MAWATAAGSSHEDPSPQAVPRRQGIFPTVHRLVGINCAMGAAELGRMMVGDVLLNHKHEYADRLKFTSSEEDCFVRMYRPKTGVFSQHILWDETADLLHRATGRAEAFESELVFCREN